MSLPADLDVTQLNDGSYVLESGEVVLPEELNFYEGELGVDWHAELAHQRDAIYDQLIKVTPSEFVEFAVKIPHDGIPEDFDFTGREYLRIPYDIQTERLLLMCGRQVEKSTLLGNSILARMAIVPHFRALYVSPSHLQTKEFRRDRIGTPIALSEILSAYLSSKSANNMSIIQFVNFSQLVLRYAYLTADRVRGIPTDSVYIDEIQDILTDNIPVIEECASHGRKDMRMFVYSGTPKSYDNTIEHIWQKRSTQNEYAIPCTCRTIVDMSAGDAKHHSSEYFWNAPLDETNIGLKGLSCARCGNIISSEHPDCTWASMNPSIRNHPKIEPFESFRIPQLMVPWVDWKSILNKQESYPRARFFNEVLAKSYDSGTRPLRIDDLLRNSVEDLSFRDMTALRMKTAGRPIFMGIDWGTGENSYTVITMGAYLPHPEGGDRFTIFYYKRCTGQLVEPHKQLELIHGLISNFNPLMVGTDYGGGFDRNNALITRYGPLKISRYQYIGGHQATKRPKLVFDGTKGRYLVDRTEVMADIFNAIRSDKVGFPRWAEWQDPYGSDFLSIFSEYNEATRMIMFDKSPSATDDAFHSFVYCFLASMIRYPRHDILHPRKGS